mmetsp:Transcript_11096/g.18807  ORF Transcript_11096/g.18807 Transcript_11096/m.18807 type:complete len:209 (+) Transcript_11096:2189-2815(+)
MLQPVVWALDLLSISDLLVEHSVRVTESITPSGHVKSGQGVHETGSEASQSSVSKTSISFLVIDGLEVSTEVVHGLRERILQTKVDDGVLQRTSNEELEREVRDTLAILLTKVTLCLLPSLNQTITHTEGEGLELPNGRQVLATLRERVLDVVHKELFNRTSVFGQVRSEHGPEQGLLLFLSSADARESELSEVVLGPNEGLCVRVRG